MISITNQARWIDQTTLIYQRCLEYSIFASFENLIKPMCLVILGTICVGYQHGQKRLNRTKYFIIIIIKISNNIYSTITTMNSESIITYNTAY